MNKKRDKVIEFYKQLTYDKIKSFDYDYYMLKDEWSVFDAASFIAYNLAISGYNGEEDLLIKLYDENYDNYLRMISYVVASGNMPSIVLKFFPGKNEVDFYNSTIEKDVVIKWSIASGVKYDSNLFEKYAQISDSPDNNIDKIEKILRKSQRHRERCRAIAQMLWDAEPDIRIAQMSFRDEIIKYGCEGKIYAEDTMRSWLKDLCPTSHPGRSRKQI